ARHRRGGRPELAANLGGGIRLQVPDVELTGAALQQEQDTGSVARPGSRGFRLEQPRQRQASEAKPAHPEPAAPVHEPRSSAREMTGGMIDTHTCPYSQARSAASKTGPSTQTRR